MRAGVPTQATSWQATKALDRPQSLPRRPRGPHRHLLGGPPATHFRGAWTLLVSGAPSLLLAPSGPRTRCGERVRHEAVQLPGSGGVSFSSRIPSASPFPEPGNLMKRRELSAAPSAVSPGSLRGFRAEGPCPAFPGPDPKPGDAPHDTELSASPAGLSTRRR